MRCGGAADVACQANGSELWREALVHARGGPSPSNPGGQVLQNQDAAGIISRVSAHSVDETVSKVRTLLEQRQITLFTVIDHSGEAAKVGLTMPPTKLLIFGNPKGGTPVMLAAPSSAIDLPLKLLVWQDADGKTWLSYNDPKYLQNRHHFPVELMQNLAGVGVLAEQAAQ